MTSPPINPLGRLPLFFLLFLVITGCGLQFSFALPAGAETQKIYTVEVWRFPTKNAAEKVHWLLGDLVPKKYWPTLRVELIGNKFSVRVGKTYDKLEADRLLEIVSQRHTTAIIVKTVYDESRVITWYVPLEPEAEEPPPEEIEIVRQEAPAGPTPAPETVTEPEAVVPSPAPESEAREAVVEETVPAEVPEGPAFPESPAAAATAPDMFAVPDPDLPQPEQEIYTIQVGSFNKLRRAKKLYLDLEWLLSPAERAFLRVERVNGYNTVRVGGFDAEAEALLLLDKIRELAPEAYILQARILEQRLDQLYRTPPVPSGSAGMEPQL